MSWLFGMSKRDDVPQGDAYLKELGIPVQPPAASGGAGGGGGDGSKQPGDGKTSMEAYRFDSAALERAAQAARELERSSK